MLHGDEGDDETWDIGTTMDPDGRAYDLGDEAEDDEEDDLVTQLARARASDAHERATPGYESADVVVDQLIVEDAVDRPANLLTVRKELEMIAAKVPSDAIGYRLVALRLLGTRCSPAQLMDARRNGNLAAFFASMEDENDADECFESLFEDVAQEALLSVPAFSALFGAYGENTDPASDAARDRIMDAYVDALRTRCAMR